MNKILQLINTEDLKQIENPCWEDAGRVHDWRNYIPDDLQKIWECLSLENRIIAYYLADNQASAEEWD